MKYFYVLWKLPNIRNYVKIGQSDFISQGERTRESVSERERVRERKKERERGGGKERERLK